MCSCDAYLKHLQFDDENKSWHISAENFSASHAKLEQGRATVCVCVCVGEREAGSAAVGEAGSCLNSV